MDVCEKTNIVVLSCRPPLGGGYGQPLHLGYIEEPMHLC